MGSAFFGIGAFVYLALIILLLRLFKHCPRDNE